MSTTKEILKAQFSELISFGNEIIKLKMRSLGCHLIQDDCPPHKKGGEDISGTVCTSESRERIETLGEDNRVIIREMDISQQPAEARITQSYQNNSPSCGFRLPASRTRRLQDAFI